MKKVFKIIIAIMLSMVIINIVFITNTAYATSTLGDLDSYKGRK